MARHSSTYRGARRNMVLRPLFIDGVKQSRGVWAPHHYFPGSLHQKPHRTKPKYFPPPAVRANKRDRARLGEPRR